MYEAFYISLVRELHGYYVKVIASNEDVVREHCMEYYGKLWCSVYNEANFLDVKEKYEVIIVNESNPVYLGGCPQYE